MRVSRGGPGEGGGGGMGGRVFWSEGRARAKTSEAGGVNGALSARLRGRTPSEESCVADDYFFPKVAVTLSPISLALLST